MEQYQNMPDKGSIFPVLKTINLMKISAEPLAADLKALIPDDPDQWYNKDRRLFMGEVANMINHYPGAHLGFLKSTGEMYWIVELKIVEGISWTFFVGYRKNHPDLNSVYVTLLKSPSFSDLYNRAKENGRPGIPHTHRSGFGNGDYSIYLDILKPGDEIFKTNKNKIFSAVMALRRAADWAIHFENGLKNKEEWNKWCDNKRFKYLKIE